MSGIEREYINSLLDQINHLKSELDWYRQENIRLQGICFGSAAKEEPEFSEVKNYEPMPGPRFSTPSSRRAEIERLERRKAKENAAAQK